MFLRLCHEVEGFGAQRACPRYTPTSTLETCSGWLDMLHEDLDRQVLAAYRLPDNVSDDDLLAELLKLNLARAAG